MVFQFNQFTLDTNQYQLSLSDKPISIEPLAFDLLVYLIQNRDRVVPREELLDKLWKGKVVSDAALGARLKDARKAVQDSGSKQQILKTVHGRGCQFTYNLPHRGLISSIQHILKLSAEVTCCRVLSDHSFGQSTTKLN